MEREHRIIGPDLSESPRPFVNYIIRACSETDETICIPHSCLPDLWYEIHKTGMGFLDVPDGWGPVRGLRRAWPTYPEFKSWTETHVEQFGTILFDSKDVLRPTGYLALLEMERQLALAREKAYQELRRCLVRIWEDRASIPSFDDVREARCKLDEARRGRAETVSEFYNSDLGSKWSTYGAVSRVVEEYLQVSTRHVILVEMLKEFVRYGTRLKCEVLPEDGSDQGPFDVQLKAILTAILRALEERDPRRLRNNAELYRFADEVDSLRYSDPYNTILKSMARHFEPRYGQKPPSTPKEWLYFFKGSGCEIARSALGDLGSRHYDLHLSPDECRRMVERIHNSTRGERGLSLVR